MKKLVLLSIILLLGILSACGGNEEATSDVSEEPVEEKKELVIGATSGPYADMVSNAIKPLLEEKGYEIEVIEFSDYVQPNIALGNGSLDANLFQHKIYMENFATEHNIELSELIVVPTAPMGIYSNKFESIEEIEEGSELALPNDPTNLARTLMLLEGIGLISVDGEINQLTASEKDVTENPKNLKFSPIEAGQLPRAVDGVDLAAVPGNFALAAQMDLLSALALEEMPDDFRNRVVMKTADLDAQFAKDIIEVVESLQFEEIIDQDFQGFGKPQWMVNR
ncbi:MetQ/NlpA family ABC transporter substrate-binding protein [Bacillus sp. FJAT-45350]|uniref:MetQ/NlpA family ABC transporter substrate-binding protein n=1 Tax=Bacillus sp. FJAT-45350 TaxID=2011014 RepID=UPI000BB8EB21|nr:MetQ/NlpA family ABC transporter substrate-binding protein [Bacillus sp. FJAT-45350]